ncbi:hypothetical protein JCM10908_000367 [Rhodotorula pacifica]|uniref:esterase/lipase family protein n=1 Tax=Rhodotorula pacifica TaxID=1495444 RepID=UPI003180C84D
MPSAVLLPGQVRSTLGCLASAFAASSSATALAVLPAQLAKDLESPDQYTLPHPKRLSLRAQVGPDRARAARRKEPVLDVERAVAAAAGASKRAQRRRSGEAIQTQGNVCDDILVCGANTPGVLARTTSPTPARLPQEAQMDSSASPRSRLPRSQHQLHAIGDVGRPGRGVRLLSTTSKRRQPALDRHDSPAAGPHYPTSDTSSRSYAVSSDGRTPPPGSPAPPSPQPASEKVETAKTVSPPVQAATLPGPSSSSQKSPRPPSPYGEINDLARHPLLYDPVLAPRFPIILCHGLYGFDVRGPGFFRLHYWGDLLKVLRGKIGAEVFVTAVPGTGSVKNRAQVLHKSLEDTPDLLNRDVNFVAHSMGGLDARYLISNIRPTLYHPRSLTTLCTPHRGSEFMAWCRANIGIGTEYESNEALNLRPCNSSSLDEPDDPSLPLPFSLKAPLLSRESIASKDEKALNDESRRSKVSSVLPFNLSSGVTSYLLDLLDSPAYANLTPNFLRDVFNPSTPDREGVRYFSIAARTPRIPIWHPLWLPKLVLDGAEKRRVDQGKAAPPEWRGNDGLVSLDSARWGEFLGTFDMCDHWEMRGSSGLSTAELSKQAVDEVTRREFRDSREPHPGGQAEKVAGGKEDRGWQWQDVYALVGKLVGASNGNGNGNGKSKTDAKPQHPNPSVDAQISMSPPPAASASTSPAEQVPAQARKPGNPSDADGLASAASWIIRQLPGADAKRDNASDGSSATRASKTVAQAGAERPVALDTTARLMYGAAGSSTTVAPPAKEISAVAGSSTTKASKTDSNGQQKPDKFSLERMALALCRKLHNEGL